MRTGTVAGTGRLIASFALTAVLLAGCSTSGSDDDAKTDDTTTTTTADETTTTSTSGGSGEGADLDPAEASELDPASHRDAIGETFDYTCPKNGTESTIWGTEIYTDDSSVCTAAAHVGLIELSSGGDVTIEIAAGQDEYESARANGIESKSYGSWGGSFTFPEAPPGSGTFESSTETWGISANTHSLTPGDTFTLECTPNGELGRIWGSDPYTSDSSICTAGVHSGTITLEEGGEVSITVTEGEDSYTGSTANGVTTSDYGSYGTSYTVS